MYYLHVVPGSQLLQQHLGILQDLMRHIILNEDEEQVHWTHLDNHHCSLKCKTGGRGGKKMFLRPREEMYPEFI